MSIRVAAVVFVVVLAAACTGAGERAPPPADTSASAQPLPPAGVSLGLPPAQRSPAAPQPAVARISIAGYPTLGAAEAPVTIVEFMDYECPYCQGWAQDTLPQLQRQYVDTGKVRYVARDFPLPRHPRARPAAIAAACAGEQGRYWEMHEALFAAAGQLRDADFTAHARHLGLDQAQFDACRSDPRHAVRLDRAFAEARTLGVAGTPTLLIGASAGELAQGRLVTAPDFAALEELLAHYLGR